MEIQKDINSIEENILTLPERYQKKFRNITIGLYIALIIVEVSMFFVLYSQNLIYESIPEYLRLYLIKPVLRSTLVILAGVTTIHVAKKGETKQAAHVLMITLMLGNAIHVHSIFVITFAMLCIPIFITVVCMDKKLLNIVTGTCVVIIAIISVDSYISGHGASNDKYFIPSVIIVIALFLGCRFVAGMLMDILKKQREDLLEAIRNAKEAQIRADESNKSKSLFLSNMSHEIRTPINAVLGLDEMIIRESKESVIKDYAMDIRSSGNALLSLVNDVLDFSKIESGRMELIPVSYEVGAMLNDLVNIISKRAYDKGLSFEIEVDKGIPSVLNGDEIRIKQVITNLLTNAVKYTEKGSVKLIFGYKKYDNDSIVLSVSVKDTGMGIKPEDMNKLFTPFERIEENRNRKVEGTGLGMSIVVKLLSLMDSRINVESVYGEGSNFYFNVVQKVEQWEPVGDYQESYRKMKRKEADYHESFVAPDAKILVVDDMPVNLRVVKGLLKQTKIQIDLAHSGAECLEFARKQKYHIIFLDHMMPEMDGIETLKHLKADEDSLNKDVPAVALTANAVSGIREYYIGEGFSEYLTKPIDSKRMEQLVVHFLPPELVETE